MKRLAAIALAILATVPATSAEADARKSVLMLSHWQCYQWARMFDDQPAVERHFNAGLEAGQVFLAAAEAGTITPEEANSIVPMSVALTLSGPNVDFILGRLFETVSTSAYEAITTVGVDGMPLSPADYIIDDELVSTLAQARYNRSNCSLL
jgi:hypothetical protein